MWAIPTMQTVSPHVILGVIHTLDKRSGNETRDHARVLGDVCL